MMTSKSPLTTAKQQAALEIFGVRVGLDPAAAVHEQSLSLAHALVGAAEMHAALAEEQARAAGAGPAEIGEATAQAFNGAGTRTAADDLQLLSWEATRLCQRIGAFAGTQPRGGDELLRTVLMTAGALSGLLNVAQTMSDPEREDGATKDAAALLPKAITALEKAAEKATGQRFLADLLGMTD
jgi:hypothetical protein